LDYGITRLRSCLFTLSATLVFLFSVPGSLWAAREIKLDADRITFDETTGVATAEGDVRISNEEMSLDAPYVEYDSATQSVRASSTPEGSVVFMSAGKRISGEKLDYNLSTSRGVFTRPNGRVDAFYVKGESIEVMPVSDVIGKKTADSGEIEELAGRWSGVVVTTCNYPNPHYRLEAKELSVIPGRRVIIRKPKVFLGETLIFTYPFDFVTNIGGSLRSGRQAIFPKLGYESGKGAGIGLSGPFVWDTGTLDLEFIWWSENIWEGEALLRQEVAPGMSAFARIARQHDKDSGDTLWRPKWGLWYERGGWQFEAAWSERELVRLEKHAGRDSRYVVWRKPEVNVVTPWIDDAASYGRFRFLGSWGRYEDATSGGEHPTVERIGAGIQFSGSFQSASPNFKPFYNAVYWHYGYDGPESDTQQILDAAVGASWRLGSLEMESAYLRRWAWGQSPMAWDSYGPREDIYHQIGMRIPTGSRDFWWNIAARGAYSIKNDSLEEMLYKVLYNQHCLQWELIYRDDMAGDDDWIGLKLTINAYPESGFRLTGNDPFDPASAPDSLAPDFIKGRQ
jgi:LPS-assembly protein